MAWKNAAGSGPKLSAKKRAAFSFILAVLILIACELIAWCALLLSERDFTLQKLQYSQTDIATGSAASDGATEVFHPYVGWVRNPQLSVPERYSGGNIRTNWLGFLDDSESIYKRSPETFVVGIAGGSVAWGLSWEAKDLLREKLASHPALKGREIRIVRLAMPGYKQPQQLMAYNFLLSLGAEFDLIINIDGYNEAVLPIAENYKAGTAVFYPRAWHGRTIAITDPGKSADAARLLQLRGQRQRMAKAAVTSIWRWSCLYNLVWKIRDQSARNELTDLGLAISKSRTKSFTAHGPENRFSSNSLEAEVTAIWHRCSLQLHHLCKANGSLYLHVLQPNQYFPDSKPLSETELKFGFDPDGDSAALVPKMYPQLVDQGRKLGEMGVEFSDQTMVFSGVEKTLYVDPWCHFNEEGHLLLAQKIADRILHMIDKNSSGILQAADRTE